MMHDIVVCKAPCPDALHLHLQLARGLDHEACHVLVPCCIWCVNNT